MKKVITTLTLLTVTTLGIATVVWAEHGGPRDDKHHGKHPFGKMVFKKMDADNDGAISVREHEAGLQKMLGMFPTFRDALREYLKVLRARKWL